MLVRKATLEDVERVAQLNHDLGLHHGPYHQLYSLKENALELVLPYIKEKIEKSALGDSLILVAQDKEIVGFLMCAITDLRDPQWKIGKMGHIGAVYVVPAYRRRGIAAALMKEALKWMKNREVEYVDLNVVAQNSAAIAAWKALGFELVSHNSIQKL